MKSSGRKLLLALAAAVLASGLSLNTATRLFLPSRTSRLKLCQLLDPAHTLESASGGDLDALQAYNGSVNDEDKLRPTEADSLSQRVLSQAIEKRSLAQLKDGASQSRRAFLSCVCDEEAENFVTAPPCKAARLKTEPALFVAMLRRWLRMRFSAEDTECQFCDGVLDGFGDHALVCCGGGCRTRRHNLIRNMAFHAAEAANLQPELERPGLLP